ncbi:putative calmodulin-binding protein [Handroanthus impetiginosus]|uniref:Putative calmodulin-binding protein n=1 Tax=Handroanthus impetiginosus TaxID=429701 RepID=A0A2G9HY93_9LAMI|nr:putative calmodulin-binding protein [Handroanthus impetiginosus]
MSIKYWLYKQKSTLSSKLRKMMKCICSGEQLRGDEIIPSSESLATRDYSASGFSSRAGETDANVDTSNIEEAESSLRESGYLNYEEARALLGRLEYQKGNVEAALRVFEGIDIAAVIPRIKITLVRKCELPRRHSQSDNTPPMSMHAVSLLVEAIFLKAKSLQVLGRYTEAAQSCKVILDTFESAIPDGLTEKFASDCKLLETLNKTVELLPELFKLAHAPQEAILAYRRALLYQWNLDMETRTNIEKDFAIFLLYSGNDASPPSLRSQTEGSFIPKNNVEEAVLLLLLILKKFILNKIGWDPSILSHLTFALSIAGECGSLALQIEELSPGTINQKEKYTSLALCYHAEDDGAIALNLLRNLLNNRENQNCRFELLLASKICTENSNSIEEGMEYIHKVLAEPQKCHYRASLANYLLGLSHSAQSRGVVSDAQRISRQSEALEALETAQRMTSGKNSSVLFALSLENAEQRKLDAALYYAKELLKVDGGSNVKGWILLARILSAQRRYVDAENVMDAALDESGKWEQGELLRTKAKLQIVQGHLRDAIVTYTKLLALLQVQRKSSRKLLKDKQNNIARIEMETWHDLAQVYTSLSQWRDAEICLSKSEAIDPHSASRLHSAGLLYEAKGLQKEALKSFEKALDIEPNHVPSLISTAIVLRQISNQSLPVAKSFLTDALRLERTNPAAWYNLGLLYLSENGTSALEAAECFEAAALLQESEPVEPFR